MKRKRQNDSNLEAGLLGGVENVKFPIHPSPRGADRSCVGESLFRRGVRIKLRVVEGSISFIPVHQILITTWKSAELKGHSVSASNQPR